jgi:hypothetical protein
VLNYVVQVDCFVLYIRSVDSVCSELCMYNDPLFIVPLGVSYRRFLKTLVQYLIVPLGVSYRRFLKTLVQYLIRPPVFPNSEHHRFPSIAQIWLM